MHATASMLPEAYSSSLASSFVYEAPTHAKELDQAHWAEARDGSAAKGLLMAIGLQAAAAVVVCITWLGWHLIR